MTPIYNAHDAVMDFVASGIFPHDRGFGAAKAIGFARHGLIVAGVVYHNYDPEAGSIEISAFATDRRWTCKAVIRTIFEYPFEQLGCRLAIARHSERNTRVTRIWNAFGAEQITLPYMRGPNEAEIVSLLTREAWQSSKFMRQANGR